MSRHTPEEIWKHLVDEAGEDDVERAASVGVEDAERDLAAAGFDVAAERANAGAFLHSPGGESALQQVKPSPDENENDTPPQSGARVLEPSLPVAAVEQVASPQVVARGERRRPVMLWIGAAATVAGGASALLYAALHAAPAPPPPPVSAPAPTGAPSMTTDPIAADGLRRRGAAACDAKQWSVCLEDLDEARKLDPAGDDSPSVRMARDLATRHMQEKPGPARPQVP